MDLNLDNPDEFRAHLAGVNYVGSLEGWGIFETDDEDHEQFELQRDDEAGRFATDSDAMWHVLIRAVARYRPHLVAIELIRNASPGEYQHMKVMLAERTNVAIDDLKADW